MKKVFISWIGFNDLDSLKKDSKGKGPVRAFIDSDFAKSIDEFHFIFNSVRADDAAKFLKDLHKNYEYAIYEHDSGKIDPTDFRQIYVSVKKVLDEIEEKFKGKSIQWHFHTSPGTPQMSSVWLLLSATMYKAVLYQAYQDKVSVVDIPFNIDAEYIDKLRTEADRKLNSIWSKSTEASLISHKSEIMKDTLETALKIAHRDVPAFILGETGTGKEEFAKFIHENSKRSGKLFHAVNCAAIPEELVESTLFGHEKGSFTGASLDKVGVFEAYNGGTIFLDEIGDLSLNAQTKILRVLQEFEIQKVGSIKSIKVDVRIISATHKDPAKLISEGKFREDLFHRINIGMFKIPPLREREEDIMTLADFFLNEINQKFSEDTKAYLYKHKKFSVSTKNFIKNYGWTGNVRELKNSIIRACMMIDGGVIEVEKFKELLVMYTGKTESIVDGLKVSLPVKLDDMIEEIRLSHIESALEKSGGNKTKAAKLLGWESYQKLDHYLKKINDKK